MIRWLLINDNWFYVLKISRGWKDSMRNRNQTVEENNSRKNRRFGKLFHCLCGGEQIHRRNEMIPSSVSLGIKDYSASAYSSQAVEENDKKPDTGSIEEAELSLRDSGSLSYEVCFPNPFANFFSLEDVNM